MEKQKAKLENWFVQKSSTHECLIGQVTGHPKLEDGSSVRTSKLVNPVKDGDTQAETLNTIYELGVKFEMDKDFCMTTPTPQEIEVKAIKPSRQRKWGVE